MGKFKGLVKVDGRDQVRIVLRQHQLVQSRDRVPVSRSHDHRTGRVGIPHRPQKSGKDDVPLRLVQFVVRLVEQFKVHLGRPVLVSARRSLPQRDQPRQMLIRVGIHPRVMMHVHDDVELVRECLVDGPVDTLGEFRIDRVRGVFHRVGGPVDRQPNGVETRFLDHAKVIGLQSDAPVAFLRSVKGVADVDTSSEFLVRGVDIHRLLGRHLGDHQRGQREDEDGTDEKRSHGVLLRDNRVSGSIIFMVR